MHAQRFDEWFAQQCYALVTDWSSIFSLPHWAHKAPVMQANYDLTQGVCGFTTVASLCMANMHCVVFASRRNFFCVSSEVSFFTFIFLSVRSPTFNTKFVLQQVL